MRISEVFHSIQGEGPFAGLPTVFARFTGCDLRCRWCDTAYAFHGGERLGRAALIARMEAFPCRRGCLTGGEPLLQPELPALCGELLDRGWSLSVETGGHRDLGALPAAVTRVVDVKCPGSGEGGTFLAANLGHLHPGDELKFVVASLADADWALDFCRSLPALPGVRRRLSPVHGALALPELAARLLASGLDAGLALQLHKFIWSPDARGV
jgi:7-carboxy-7-deazaguanine synthase